MKIWSCWIPFWVTKETIPWKFHLGHQYSIIKPIPLLETYIHTLDVQGSVVFALWSSTSRLYCCHNTSSYKFPINWVAMCWYCCTFEFWISVSYRQGSILSAYLGGMQILEIGSWVTASSRDMNPRSISSASNPNSTRKSKSSQSPHQNLSQHIKSLIWTAPDLSLSTASHNAVFRCLLSHCTNSPSAENSNKITIKRNKFQLKCLRWWEDGYSAQEQWKWLWRRSRQPPMPTSGCVPESERSCFQSPWIFPTLKTRSTWGTCVRVYIYIYITKPEKLFLSFRNSH